MATKINETLETLLSHRSVRRFTDDPVAAADIERVVTAGQAASTSSAVQAYCLIRVTDASVREQIAELSGPQAMVEKAPAFFVVCGDARRHRLVCEREGGAYKAGFEGFVVSVIDATLFAQNLAVAFESMGYGLCFVGGIRNDLERLTALLELPEGVYPLYGLVVGRPDQSPDARPRLPVSAVLFEDRYPDDATVFEQIDAYDAVYRAYLEARGATPKTWSSSMAGKLGKPLRPGLASFYEGRGADLS
jgi:FMN reductase (NADPH)